MTQSSLNAYIQGMVSGNFKNDSDKILYLLSQKPMNMPQIGEIIGKDPRQFSSRLSKLMDHGKIEIIESGKHSVYSVVTDTNKQKLIQELRNQETIEKWLKKGRELGLLNEKIESFIFDKQPTQLTLFQV